MCFSGLETLISRPKALQGHFTSYTRCIPSSGMCTLRYEFSARHKGPIATHMRDRKGLRRMRYTCCACELLPIPILLLEICLARTSHGALPRSSCAGGRQRRVLPRGRQGLSENLRPRTEVPQASGSQYMLDIYIYIYIYISHGRFDDGELVPGAENPGTQHLSSWSIQKWTSKLLDYRLLRALCQAAMDPEVCRLPWMQGRCGWQPEDPFAVH